MRRISGKRWIWVVVFCAVLVAGFFGFRAHKFRRVEGETQRYFAWLKEAVLDRNPVQLVGVYGREPDWFGPTNIHAMLETPTGAQFSLNALIESSVLDTRVVRLDLYFLGGRPANELPTTKSPRSSGVAVELPIGTVAAGNSLDLKALLPSAFVAPPR